MAATVYIKGLKELKRDFGRISKDLDRKLVKALQEAAQPAADKAESYALGRIRNMPGSPDWAGMRIGVARGGVYLAPAARSRRRRSRPNLGPLLMDLAMGPAVEQEQAVIVERVGDLIDKIADSNGFS